MRVADGLMQETPKSSIWLRFTAEPRTGRFITRDSYRGERENANTWHLYAYCANNPINYVDPSGHKFFSVYKYKNQKRYKLTMKQDALTAASVTLAFIGVCVGRLPAGMISAAAGTALLTIGVATAVTSLIMDKYLKNHALTVRIWFSYKYKQKTTRVRRQGRRYKITRKWVKIYNIKKEAKLRG